VGSGPPAALREVANPRIIVTGTVPDVRPYLQFARAVIAPLHIARGIQNKVLEAMAMAKPVVATPDATRSLGIRAGHHLWVENEPARFADAVLEALQGASREAVARNARKYVEDCHDWPVLLKNLDHHLALLQPSGTTASDSPVTRRPAAGQHFELSAQCKS
jgi:glycosyltransferase involved in cell wall biosynthesis